jgi:hypothetical protein
MTNAEIYLRAAEMTDAFDEGTCRTVQRAATGKCDGCVSEPHLTTYAYQKMFAPLEQGNQGYWGYVWGEDRRFCRVLALCFAAAMAETGDL